MLASGVTQTGMPTHGPHMLASGVFEEENEETHLRLYNQSTVCTYSALLDALSLYSLVLLLVTRSLHYSTLKQFRLLGMPLPLQV